MENIQLNFLKQLIEQRQSLFNDKNYLKYQGRNQRINNYINKILPYLDRELSKDEKLYIIKYTKDQLHTFKNIPILDTTTQGTNLYNLDLNIYGNCTDYFQSV